VRHTVSHAPEYPSVMHMNNLQQTYELKDIKYKHTNMIMRFNYMDFFFIVAQCILIYVKFTHQQRHFFI